MMMMMIYGEKKRNKRAIVRNQSSDCNQNFVPCVCALVSYIQPAEIPKKDA